MFMQMRQHGTARGACRGKLLVAMAITLFASVPSACAAKPAAPLQVIIDSDLGPDDWMAILYMLRHPEAQVCAITVTGAGLAHAQPGGQIALQLLALAGKNDVAVAIESDAPLAGDHAFPADWRKASDTLTGLSLPPPEREVSTQSAVQLLEKMLQSSPAPMTVLTLGPLTNIAKLLSAKPELASKIQHLFIMGGAVHVPGNVDLPGYAEGNKVAESNIYVDPQAAQVVFESSVPLTLMPLDATNRVPINPAFVRRFTAAARSTEAKFLARLYGSISGWMNEGYYAWDPAAAVMMMTERLVTFKSEPMTVLTEGDKAGGLSVQPGMKTVRYAADMDGAAWEREFIRVLNGEK
jgi:inosine-uridine nucleoside N-ribohydrolase